MFTALVGDGDMVWDVDMDIIDAWLGDDDVFASAGVCGDVGVMFGFGAVETMSCGVIETR